MSFVADDEAHYAGPGAILSGLSFTSSYAGIPSPYYLKFFHADGTCSQDGRALTVYAANPDYFHPMITGSPDAVRARLAGGSGAGAERNGHPHGWLGRWGGRRSARAGTRKSRDQRWRLAPPTAASVAVARALDVDSGR